MRWVKLIGLVFLLAGCQRATTVYDTRGGAYADLSGATVELHIPLPIRAGHARIFIQNPPVSGDVGGFLRGGFDHYQPHCAFEITRVDHDGLTIEPDRFRITHVQQSLQQVVESPAAASHQLAAIGWPAGFNGIGSSSYHLGYHFSLYSERQPDVMRMSCYGVYAQPYELAPPTLLEIRTALGRVASIIR